MSLPVTPLQESPQGPTRGRLDAVRDGESVVVRRRSGLFAFVGVCAAVLAALFLWRAVDSGDDLSWLVGAVLVMLAGYHLGEWLDARLPMLVADRVGIRIRVAEEWHGLLWGQVDSVVVRPPKGWWSDGYVGFGAVDEVTDEEGPADGPADGRPRGRAARRLRANARRYGVPFVTAIGLTTVSSHPDLEQALRALAEGRPLPATTPPAAAPVRELPREGDPEAGTEDRSAGSPEPGPEATTALPRHPASGHPDADDPDAGDPGADDPGADDPDAGDPRAGDPGPNDGTASAAELRQPERAVAPDPASETTPADTTLDDQVPGEDVPEHARVESRPVVALRLVRRALRADVIRRGQRRAEPDPRGDDAGQDSGSERPPAGRDRQRRVRGNMSLVLDEPIDTGRREPATVLDPDDATAQELVTDRSATGPTHPAPLTAPEATPHTGPPAAPEPTIGEDLAAARRAMDQSVDDLSARTRIRGHVIEAIEEDDFGPCGGDFYARGHLRTLCSALGLDPDPVLQRYERDHAREPVDARTVFEAELGSAGAIRGVGHGPNWAALVTAVLVVVLLWAVVTYFTDGAALGASPY